MNTVCRFSPAVSRLLCLQEKAALEQELRAQLADAVAEQNSLRRWGHGRAHTLHGCKQRGRWPLELSCHAECMPLAHACGFLSCHSCCLAASLSCRRLLQVRTKELRTVRKAAQEVLLQRSEVEAFLVSSIQQARAEMAAEAAAPASEAVAAAGSASAPIQEQQDSSGTGEASRSPSRAAVRTHSSPGGCTDGGAVVEEPGSRTAAVHSSASTAGGSGPVDVRDLSWQDRERILRLLFAKINRSVSVQVCLRCGCSSRRRVLLEAARRHAEGCCVTRCSCNLPPLPAVQPPVASLARTQALSEVQAETPLPQLRGLATEAGPAGLA